MSWVKLDDGFAEHPKIARVGAVGAWIQVQALCYANRNLTDGFIPAGIAQSFVARGVEIEEESGSRWRLAETSGRSGRDLDEIDWPGRMVAAGLWECVPSGYRIHDYGDYQPSKAAVLSQRTKIAERVQRHRKERRNAVSSAVTDTSSNVDRNEVTDAHGSTVGNGVTNTACTPAPVPVPEGNALTSVPTRAPARENTPAVPHGHGAHAPLSVAPPPDPLPDAWAPMARDEGCSDPPRQYLAFSGNYAGQRMSRERWLGLWRKWTANHRNYACPCGHGGGARVVSLPNRAPIAPALPDRTHETLADRVARDRAATDRMLADRAAKGSG